MCDEDYARHIIQKHRLAVALAVIKTKPENLTLDAYLQEIRDKLNPIIVIDDSDDDSPTDHVSSEDFNFNNDDDDNLIPQSLDTVILDSQANDHNLTVETNDYSHLHTKNTESKVVNTNDATFDDLTTNLNTQVNFDENAQNFNLSHIKNTNEAAILLNFDESNVKSKDNTQITIADVETNLNDSMNILEGLGDLINDNAANDTNVESQEVTEVFDMIRNVEQNVHNIREDFMNSQTTLYESYPLSSNTALDPTQTMNFTRIDNLDSQATILYNLDEHSQFRNHYSQSQMNYDVINPHFIRNNEITTQVVNNNDDSILNSVNSLNNETRQDINENRDKVNTLNISRDQSYTREINNEEPLESIEMQEIEHSGNIFESQLEKGFERQITNDHYSNENPAFSDEEPTPSQEVLPFKIIEEMNKVKSALNKRQRSQSTDGFSTDSGYRSDSQKSQRISLHLSENWLNQSGCSLMKYLIESPLTNNTEVIYKEIAQVLGDLIDKLHENEKYPTFLEDVLENVDNILKELHEAPNDGELPMQKDDLMHRIILLNKSKHIQKYTITKITTILEELHANLTEKDQVYELKNIDQIENVNHIFHLLEIIIQKYEKSKESSTFSSQNSNSDFKRSFITDVWRKKWCANKDVATSVKIDRCPLSSVNVNVLSKCGEILNKIVVGCMESYSLVSFAALQCFNLLQK